MRRSAAPLAVVAIALCAVTAAGVDAGRRRAERERETSVIRAVARVLPGPDLALAGGARHLRFLSLEEPGAAFADGPASLDADPAGGAVAPPIAVWSDEARRRGDVEITRGR